MKVKELKRTVNVSWSPASQYPVMLATGTAAQQMDSSFSSNAYLELYSLNLNDPGYDMEVKSSIQSPHKFHKLVWSPSGVLVGGCDGGLLQFYNVDKLLNGGTDALVASSTKHNGHVSALDINPFQKNLLASGASDSEIYIWDLNNTGTPMAPGTKSQPAEHVQDLAWNQQVQHILASTFATRCVVWDLRKNEPIMKLSDAQSRTRWRAVAWHPSIATQVCIASEDDQVPVIQLWDLRLAASPLATLEKHQKGVLSLSWCQQDRDLLLSAGKDGKVLCWNPNNNVPGGDLLSEISSEGQWVFDVAWCPRNPCLVASASFDGHVNVHSVNGGTKPNVFNKNSNIMDSFPESCNQLPVLAPDVKEPQKVHQLLPRTPKWAQRPVRAKFAFGGKLVSFGKPAEDPNSQPGVPQQRLVYISQVVTEPEVVERAAKLDMVLGSKVTSGADAAPRLAEYCRQRGDVASDQHERYMWFFLKASFEPDYRSEILNLLGYKRDEILSKFAGSGLTNDDQNQYDAVDSITNKIAGLSRGESSETEAEISTETSTDLSDTNTLIERQLPTSESKPRAKNVTIKTDDEPTGLICRSLIGGNLEEAVELCLKANKIPEALMLASTGNQELLMRVQNYYLSMTSFDPVSLLTRTLLLSRWSDLISDSAKKCWKESLAMIVTYCDEQRMSQFCDELGNRLLNQETGSGDSWLKEAVICYLCSASVDALVGLWLQQLELTEAGDFEALSRLVELSLLAKKAAAIRGRPVQTGGQLESVLIKYAQRLASQGYLEAALASLEGVTEPELRHRLECALELTTPFLYGKQGTLQHQGQNNYWSGQNSSRVRTTSGAQSVAPRRSIVAPQPPAKDFYNTGVASVYEAPAPTPAQSWSGLSQQQPTSAPPLPPPVQPPRPPSVGLQSLTGGVTGRSKYLVDPSVKSNHYNNYMHPVQAQPIAASYNSFNPSPYADSYSQSQSISTPFNTAQTNPTNLYNPNANMATVPNGGYYGNQAGYPETQASIKAPPPTPAAPGWNDPPMLTSAHKPKEMSAKHAGTRRWSHIINSLRHRNGSESKPEMSTPAPITHPLFGVEPAPQHIPLAPAGGFPPQMGSQHIPLAPPGSYQPQMVYGQAPQTYQPMQTNMHNSQPPKAASPVLAAEVIQKAAIPEQHIHMQTVFDALRAQCALVAPNPQIKRKLEDVQRRLETLYNLLREHKLSENALSVLHTSVQRIQSADYANALAELTTLATGPDFAAVAAFLPGLKVLVQVANQCQVYLR